ncbi:hypothetical protein [Arthrobacter sp. StoSoilB20]|uniref:hypothetical protein n=1 Tax=Arthrobacter sp. StoSoilB20 TaxID=2830995 RepID=UPI001CC70350|nr:hypothetical protein [Arthrobacter sp. StoSoilB20]
MSKVQLREAPTIQSWRPANSPAPAAGLKNDGGLPPQCPAPAKWAAAWTNRQKAM